MPATVNENDGCADDIETEEAKKIVEKLTAETLKAASDKEEETSTREIVMAAAHAVGSLSDTEFNISFNPDVFQHHVKHSDPDVCLISIISMTVTDVFSYKKSYKKSI